MNQQEVTQKILYIYTQLMHPYADDLQLCLMYYGIIQQMSTFVFVRP